MYFNYHTHTHRCNHAAPDEREYIENAIKAGIKVLGFSDHSPYFFEGDYYSNFRMRPARIYDYFDTLSELKEEYKNSIDIKIGFETEYYPAFFQKVLEFYKDFPVEYMILGQHFVDNEMGAHYSGRPTAKRAILEKYVNQVMEGMDTGLYTYVAHPDLLRFIGDDDIYIEEYSKLCRKSVETGIPLELNFLGLKEGRHYPDDMFWEIAGKMQCPVVFGVDAHNPQALNDPETLASAMQMCEKYKLNLQETLELVPVKSF